LFFLYDLRVRVKYCGVLQVAIVELGRLALSYVAGPPLISVLAYS
jgi:hypothetical protein